MMTLSKRDFALRPETTLGQIWETVRQWILNSPYSKFKKVPQKLPTKICEGEFEWCANEAKDDFVKLSRVGDGMEIVSSRVRQALKWQTVMTFTRQKKQVKCSVKVLIDGTIPAEAPLESKVPQVVKQLMKTYGLQVEERAGGRGKVLHDIQKTVHRIEAQTKSRTDAQEKIRKRREAEDKCLEVWNKYLDGDYGKPVQSGKKLSFEDLFKKPKAKAELAKLHITTKKQIADAVRNARNRLNGDKEE